MQLPVEHLGLRARDCLFTDELFSFIGTDGYKAVWNTSAIQRALDDRTLSPKDHVKIELNTDFVTHIMAFNGIEVDHVKSLTDERLTVPVLAVEMPDNTHILIDGNHRVVALHQRGAKSVEAFMFTPDMLKPFEVIDVIPSAYV